MENQLEKRLLELYNRAEARGIYVESQFLTEGEQGLLASLLPLGAYTLEGGFSEAERCIAVFGREEELGYPWESTLCLLEIAPKDIKFAEELTHRDYLGALLNLGIKRELMGDILIKDRHGYLFVLESIAAFLQENLERVRHTAVRVTPLSALPEGVSVQFEERVVVAASNRLDALISAVWNLSRSEGKDLVEKEKVSIVGKTVTDPAYGVPEGKRVSVRGYGRFYYDGEAGRTRSDRCRMRVRLFI